MSTKEKTNYLSREEIARMRENFVKLSPIERIGDISGMCTKGLFIFKTFCNSTDPDIEALHDHFLERSCSCQTAFIGHILKITV